MKNRILAILAVCAAAFLVQGCGETNARYVESGGTRSLISTKKVNIADWNSAASALVDDMLASGVLDRYEKPVVMKVSRIVNRTSEAIDTDLLTKQISITLNKSGNVLTMSEDEYTKEFANPYQAASLGYIDDVIIPKNTRFRIIRALEALANKKQLNPAKKHGNIPL